MSVRTVCSKKHKERKKGICVNEESFLLEIIRERTESSIYSPEMQHGSPTSTPMEHYYPMNNSYPPEYWDLHPNLPPVISEPAWSSSGYVYWNPSEMSIPSAFTPRPATNIQQSATETGNFSSEGQRCPELQQQNSSSVLKLVMGHVTSLEGDLGYIDKDIFFHASAVRGLVKPKKGDYVLVKAEAVQNMSPIAWNAREVQVIEKSFCPENTKLRILPEPHNLSATVSSTIPFSRGCETTSSETLVRNTKIISKKCDDNKSAEETTIISVQNPTLVVPATQTQRMDSHDIAKEKAYQNRIFGNKPSCENTTAATVEQNTLVSNGQNSVNNKMILPGSVVTKKRKVSENRVGQNEKNVKVVVLPEIPETAMKIKSEKCDQISAEEMTITVTAMEVNNLNTLNNIQSSKNKKIVRANSVLAENSDKNDSNPNEREIDGSNFRKTENEINYGIQSGSIKKCLNDSNSELNVPKLNSQERKGICNSSIEHRNEAQMKEYDDRVRMIQSSVERSSHGPSSSSHDEKSKSKHNQSTTKTKTFDYSKRLGRPLHRFRRLRKSISPITTISRNTQVDQNGPYQSMDVCDLSHEHIYDYGHGSNPDFPIDGRHLGEYDNYNDPSFSGRTDGPQFFERNDVLPFFEDNYGLPLFNRNDGPPFFENNDGPGFHHPGERGMAPCEPSPQHLELSAMEERRFRRGSCHLCGKYGHYEKECWHRLERVCKHCGKSHHDEANCRYKTDRCRICSKIGHLGRVCLKLKRS